MRVARELATNNGEKPRSIAAAGGTSVMVLGVDDDGAADKATLDAWISGNKLTLTTVRDPDGMAMQTKQALEGREYSYVIDLKTMKVACRYLGSFVNNQGAANAINSAVSDILNRLKGMPQSCPNM